MGDELPLSGLSYEYPRYMDILLLKKGKAILVRDSRVERIDELKDYSYNGLPAVNGRGLEIQIGSEEEAARFVRENAVAQEQDRNGGNIAEFLNRWLKFETYRQIRCISSHDDAESALPNSK